MKINKKKFLYLISPNKVLKTFYGDLIEVLKSNKISFFQLRLKKGSLKNKLKIAKKVKKICRKFKVKFLINDDPSLAKKIKDLDVGTKLDFESINKLNINEVFKINTDKSSDQSALEQLKDQYNRAKQDITERFEDKVLKIRSGDDLLPGVMKMVKGFVAIKRRLRPGDKMSGRHGNKS